MILPYSQQLTLLPIPPIDYVPLRPQPYTYSTTYLLVVPLLQLQSTTYSSSYSPDHILTQQPNTLLTCCLPSPTTVNNLSSYSPDHILNNQLYSFFYINKKFTCPPTSPITYSITHSSSFFSYPLLTQQPTHLLPPITYPTNLLSSSFSNPIIN